MNNSQALPATGPSLEASLLEKLKWLTSNEAFRYLGLSSVARLRNLVHQRRIPFYKPFGRLLFKRSELDKLVEATRNGGFQWR
jgi:excisionase family DNA binding protein